MKEFVINRFLKLKLEEDKTNIYVNDKQIRQCKYILFTLKKKKLKELKELESIDDLFEEVERLQIKSITPEVEFWGHCSNIQAWADIFTYAHNNYPYGGGDEPQEYDGNTLTLFYIN